MGCVLGNRPSLQHAMVSPTPCTGQELIGLVSSLATKGGRLNQDKKDLHGICNRGKVVIIVNCFAILSSLWPPKCKLHVVGNSELKKK